MEQEKIEKEFHSILDDIADNIQDKLDIQKAVERRSSSRTAGKLASNSTTLRRKVINPEIESYRRDLKEQFSTVLDAVEEGKGIEQVREDILKYDIFHQNTKRYSKEIEEKIIERFENLHSVIDRLNDSEADEVWQGVKKELTEEEARQFIKDMFGFLEEIEEHENNLKYSTEFKLSDLGLLLPVRKRVDYTPEALEVMKESEAEAREKLEEKLDELYN